MFRANEFAKKPHKARDRDEVRIPQNITNIPIYHYSQETYHPFYPFVKFSFESMVDEYNMLMYRQSYLLGIR